MLFLKSLCVISILISILITPSVLCNMVMSGITPQEESSFFDKFTLANQSNDQDGRNTWFKSINKAFNDYELNGDILMYDDIIYSFAFCVAIVVMINRINNQIDSAEYELSFMNDYSVEIKGIPRNGFEDEEFRSFIEKCGGKAIEISYAKYFDGMLNAYRRISKVHTKLKILEAKFKHKSAKCGLQLEFFKSNSSSYIQLQMKLFSLLQNVHIKYQNKTDFDKLDKILAYVIFENPKNKVKILHKFANENQLKLWTYDRTSK